jgi:hypothetical protein
MRLIGTFCGSVAGLVEKVQSSRFKVKKLRLPDLPVSQGSGWVREKRLSNQDAEDLEKNSHNSLQSEK